MIIVQYIIGGLIILTALLVFIFGLYIICQGEESGAILILLSVVFILAGIVVITDKNCPTKQDVLDGKAIYQETQVITGNDTIKTYDIVWK